MKRLALILLFLTFCATAFAGESQVKRPTDETTRTPDKPISGRPTGSAQEKNMAEAEMMAAASK